jgi:hypothetical protein
MPRQQLRTAPKRRAAILLVVVLLTTLFMVVGLAFVLYAEAQATSSRFYREANLNLDDKFPTPEDLLGWGLGQLIYDCPDDSEADSAIRGASLARTMYGWNYEPIPGTSEVRGLFNTVPYGGLGRPSTLNGPYQNPYNIDDRLLINYMHFPADGFKRDPERINPGPSPTGGGLFTGGFNAPYTAVDLNSLFLAQVRAMDENVDGVLNAGLMEVVTPSFWRGDMVDYRHIWPSPAPTLHPGNQAWTDPATLTGALAHLKYKTLRPRPVDQLLPSEIAYLNTLPPAAAEAQVRAWATPGPNQRLFPLPETQFGDVRNLPGPGQNDSIWVDLGYPVIRLAATQRKVKPLFAFLVVDLDGRVNMNVAGNIKEQPTVGFGYHGSQHGFGPWEINPRYLMRQTNAIPPLPPGIIPAGGDSNEYLDLFRGKATLAGVVGGRYGRRPLAAWEGRYWNPPTARPATPPWMPYPNAPNNLYSNPGHPSSNYALVNWDGSSVVPPLPTPPTPPPTYGQPNLWSMGGDFMAGLGYSALPRYPAEYRDGSDDERFNHPSLFNPFRLNHRPDPWTGTIPSDELDRLLPVSDMRGLIAWTSPLPTPTPADPFRTSADTLQTELARLWPNHIRLYPRLRNLVTTLSMDLDRAGAVPGQAMLPVAPFVSPTGDSPYMLNGTPPVMPTSTYATRYPIGPPTFINDPANPNRSLLPNRIATETTNIGGDLRYLPNGMTVRGDWRSRLADIGRVDVNRPLEDYPPIVNGDRPNLLGDPTLATKQWRATRDRVLLARDIFDRLRLATGAADPARFAPPAMTSDPAQTAPTNDPAHPLRQQFEALRYLAQLAANIVDFVDKDDVMTAFNFLGNQLPPEANPNAVVPCPAWGWVFGTEMPRLVVNEVYAQVQNHPLDNFNSAAAPNLSFQRGGVSDPDTPNTKMGRPFTTSLPIPATARATQPYRVNFFIELHNPHHLDPSMSENGAARLMLNPGTNPTPGLRNIYKIVIRSQVDPTLTRATDNVTGQPRSTVAAPNIHLEVQDFVHDGLNPPAGGTVPAFDRTVVMPAVGVPQTAWEANPTPKDSKYGYLGDTQDGDPTNDGNNWRNNGFALLGPSLTGAMWQAEVPHDRDPDGDGIPNTPDQAPIQPTISVADQNIMGAAAPSRLWTELPNTLDPAVVSGDLANFAPSVFLQRLAFPHLPPQPDPTQSNYNPFITVDYLENIPIQDAVLYDSATRRDGTMLRPQRQALNPGVGSGRHSFGRRQPFKAAREVGQNTPQMQSPLPAPSDRIQQTFFRQNGQSDFASPGPAGAAAAGATLDPFTWLVHYDRRIVNWADLLHVTALKPHELTQEFMNPNAPAAQRAAWHQAPWRVPDARLYRALELLGSGSFMAGVPIGGRVPGKININTMMDIEVFRALCDALQPNPASPGAVRHRFDQATVDAAWNIINANRPYMSPALPNMGAGPSFDMQYMGPPPYGQTPPNGWGNTTNRSLLRQGAHVHQGFLALPDAANHPFNVEELLKKIAGNVTTRSNVFAVYITVGFFEVRRPQAPGDPEGDAYQPVKLGRELNPPRRHKFFAIVDRTNLSLDINNPRMQGRRPIFFPLHPVNSSAAVGLQEPYAIMAGTAGPATPAAEAFVPAADVEPIPGGGVQLVLRDTIDHYGREFSDNPSARSGETASIQPGQILFLDVGERQEYIRVESVLPNVANPSRSRITFYAVQEQIGVSPALWPRIPFQFSHARGAPICTVQIGNPGPQPLPLRYDETPYADTVVPFRIILQ